MKSNIRNPENLTTFDYYYVKLIDSFSTVLLLSGIYDFTLYCSHELLHHDLYIDQTSQTNVSYYQSMVCLLLVFVEIIGMFHGIKKLKLERIQRYENKVKEIKAYIINKKNKLSYRLQAKARLNYYKRRYEYDMGSMMIYFTKGIKAQYLQKWTGRFYRFALLMKLIVFEIFIVSLQMLPKSQLMLMTTAQLVVIIIIGKALFFDRIYTHKFFGFMDLITELTIFFYLVIGNLSTYLGEDTIGRSNWTKIQLYEIYLILFTAGMNIIQVLYNACLSIYNILQERKYRVKKMKKVQPRKKQQVKISSLIFQNKEVIKLKTLAVEKSKKLTNKYKKQRTGKNKKFNPKVENSNKQSHHNKKLIKNNIRQSSHTVSVALKSKKKKLIKANKNNHH